MSKGNEGNAMLRVVTGVALLALVLSLLLVDRLSIGFTVFIAVFACVGLHEFHNMAQREASRAERIGGFAGVLAMIAAAHFGGFEFLGLTLVFAVLGVTTLHLFTGGRTIQGLCGSVFGIVYVGWFSAHFILLRHLGVEHQGGWLVLLLIVVISVSDTAAYFTGKNFGRHKLAPKVSPKKTWEGAVGAVVAAALAALLWGHWKADEDGVVALYDMGDKFVFGLYPYGLALAAAALSIVGQVGDLAESMLKRDAGVKDSGAFLPGHGGVLDRCDGFLFAGPIMYHVMVHGHLIPIP